MKKLILILLVFVVGCSPIETKNSSGGYVGYDVFEIKGMPCVQGTGRYNSGMSCYWEYYQGGEFEIDTILCKSDEKYCR